MNHAPVDYVIRGFFGNGWETVTYADSWEDAQLLLSDYASNDPDHRYYIGYVWDTV